MKAKRFHKLFQSEMTKLMAGQKGAGRCIKAAATTSPKNPDGTVIPYAETWEMLRVGFTRRGNVPPLK